MKKTDGLNASIVMAISQLWLKKFAEDESLDDTQFERHKKNLYGFYSDYCNNISDYKVYKIIAKIMQMLNEPFEAVKEFKFKELRSLQGNSKWNVLLEECEKVEKSLIELCQLFEGKGDGSDSSHSMNNEELAFVKTTTIAIEDCFKRPIKEAELVKKYYPAPNN